LQSSREATHIAIAASKEIVMSALTDISRTTQRVVCMLLATVIVAASVSLVVAGAKSASRSGYSVTISQLQ
jgi:hypothetical protein